MRKLTFVVMAVALLVSACTGGVGAANVASFAQAEQSLQASPTPFMPATLEPIPTFEPEPDLPGNDPRLFELEKDLGGELVGGDITLNIEDIPTYPNDKVIVEYVVTGYDGNYGQDYFASSGDSVGNPSVSEIIAYAKASQKAHQTPWEVMLSSCKIESGLRHFRPDGQLMQGYNRDKAGNLMSTDWGMCQINDYYHPGLMGMAKGTWQENLNAGWAVMDACWTKNGSDPRGAYGCYNGSGPSGKYANIAMSALASKFWEKAEKQATSTLPKVKTSGEKPLISPLKSSCITMKFGERYPDTEAMRNLNLVGIVHGNGTDLGLRGSDDTAYAPADVTIVSNYWSSALGNVSVMRMDGTEWQFEFFHQAKYYAEENAKVKAGSPIGQVGNTGTSTSAAHLHYRMLVDGVDVDPMLYTSNPPKDCYPLP